MSLPRFYVRQLPSDGSLTLDQAESRHATSVLRLSTGQQVMLFDGRGGEALARVDQVHKRAVELYIVRRTDTNRELPSSLTILAALPKGDRQRALVDGLVQLGVSQLVPLDCRRSVVRPTPAVIARLERGVVEACKQCGRNQLMEISSPSTIEAVCASQTSGGRWFAHPYDLPGESPHINPPRPADGLRIAIGPEGGFCDEELASFVRTGWQRFDLGPRILRIEVAALAAASWVALSGSA